MSGAEKRLLMWASLVLSRRSCSLNRFQTADMRMTRPVLCTVCAPGDGAVSAAGVYETTCCTQDMYCSCVHLNLKLLVGGSAL